MNEVIFPSFISIPNDELEDPNIIDSEIEKHHINARNILRHLFRGTKLVKNDGENFQNSLLYDQDIFVSFFTKVKPELSQAIFEELQKILDNIFITVTNNLNKDIENQLNIFLNYLPSIYPFIINPENEKMLETGINLPIKLNNQWQQVPYQIEKIDISPRVGPLSWVLEDEDKIFAYGLVANQPNVKNHLLLMGTTFPGGQGSAFANLYNIKPGYSIGEGHSFTAIKKWLDKQENENVIVSGHSKGGTMSILTALKFPEKIIEAYALNPAGLHNNTIQKYQNQNNENIKNKINILINDGDIVPYFDAGFLSGMNLLYASLNNIKNKNTLNISFPYLPNFIINLFQNIGLILEAHAHHFSGHAEVTFHNESLNIEKLNLELSRIIFNSIRKCVCITTYPIEYLNLFCKLLWRKISRFIDENEFLFTLTSFSSGVISSGVTGVSPFAQIAINVSAPFAIQATGMMIASGIALAATFWAAKTIFPPVLNILGKTLSSLLLLTGLISGVIIGFCNLGINSLNSNESNVKTREMQPL